MSTLTKVKNWYYRLHSTNKNGSHHFIINLSPNNECGENGKYMSMSGICTEEQARQISKVPSLVALAEHILAMADDAYLSGHPEWEEIVNEAKAIKL